MSDSNTETPAPRKKSRPRDPGEWIHRSMAKYRSATHQLEFRPSDAFFELADDLVQSEWTLLGYDRLYVFWQAMRNLRAVPGEIIEVGSFRGGSAYFIAAAALGIIGEAIPMRIVDTFEGHPADAIGEHDADHKPGQFHRTSYEKVCHLLRPFPHVTIHQSDVLRLLPDLPDTRYRLVHIDTDLYQPTVACLAYFGSRMSAGGVIVLDDYASPKCPGVPKAAAEYLAADHGFQVWDVRTEQLILVKR
jgi:O-methyltransferase